MNDGHLTVCITRPLQPVHNLVQRVASAPNPPGVAVRCFGRFEMTVADQAVNWSGIRPRVRTLMRYLALHAGHPVHREDIIAALWPELPGRAGVNNLQVGVSTLRTFIEPGVARGASRLIPRDGESYQLAIGEGCHSDVVSFDAAVATARRAHTAGRIDAAVTALTEALALVAGDLLPEDGPAEWVINERTRYRFKAAEAAATLARLELDSGRPHRAIRAAQRTLELDVFHDAGWRTLISAQERVGDAAAAGRSRQQYRGVLRSLGVAGAIGGGLGGVSGGHGRLNSSTSARAVS